MPRTSFFELIELEPDARPAQLDVLCGSDDALRHAVAGLLEAHDAAGVFLCELHPGAERSIAHDLG